MALAIPLWAVIFIPTMGVVILFFSFTAMWFRRRSSRLSQHGDDLEGETQTTARYRVRRGRMVPASWNVSLTGSMFGLHQFQNLEEDNLTGGRRMTRSRSPFSFFSDKSRKNRSMLSFTPSEKSRNLDDIGATTPTRENNREFLNNVDRAFLSKIPAAKVAPLSRSQTSTTSDSGRKRKGRPAPIPHRSSSQRDRTFQAQRHPPDTLSRVLSPIQASPRDSPHTLPKSPMSVSTSLVGHTSPETARFNSSAEKEARVKVIGTPSPLNPRSAWLQSPSESAGGQFSTKQSSQRPTLSARSHSSRNTISPLIRNEETSSRPTKKPAPSSAEATLPPSTSSSSSSAKARTKSMGASTPRPSPEHLIRSTTGNYASPRPKTTYDSSSRPKTSSSADSAELQSLETIRPKSSYSPRSKSSSTLRPNSIAPPAPPPKPTPFINDRPTSSLTAISRPFTARTSIASMSSDFTIASAHPTALLHVQSPNIQASSVSSPQLLSIPSRQAPPLPSLPKTAPAVPTLREDAHHTVGGESHWRPPSAWDNSKLEKEKEADRGVKRKSSIGLGANVEVGISKKGSVLRKKSLRAPGPMRAG